MPSQKDFFVEREVRKKNLKMYTYAFVQTEHYAFYCANISRKASGRITKLFPIRRFLPL